MATSAATADQFFTYEERLASFHTAQPLPKRRTSNANSKAPKTAKWPHKFLPAEKLAEAGFFFLPLPSNPDNVACFLCRRSLDGWEEGDDALVEHLKHSPDCGWAIVATIEKQDEELSQEYPSSARMIAARKATFADKWPHEGKKGWKCKTKQLVDAGWKYTPTPEYDDMATCAYCNLALDGWEPSDKPLEEHFKRSPDCTFFKLVNEHKQTPKKPKSKRDRTSKASRLSTQSSMTVASEAPSVSELAAEDEDSVLTTATNATAKKMSKAKKAAAPKGRKTRAKKGEPVEVDVPAPEPEDDNYEVKVEPAPKPTRGRKRKSDDATKEAHPVAPPPKRRATRTRGSVAIDDSIMSHTEEVVHEAPKKAAKKGRASTRSTRKTSAASVASIQQALPDDDEIDRALEADLERPLSENEEDARPMIQPKKNTRGSKVVKADHDMFGVEPMEIDEAAIEAELDAMEVDSKPLPKAKGAKGKQPRKVSAKQQAAARRAAEKTAEAEAEAERQAEKEASEQISAELEHSISMQHSSPFIERPKSSASRQQPTKAKAAGRALRGSVMSEVNQDVNMTDSHDHNDDSGHETDASMASQSTVVRGGSTRRVSKAKKGKAGKKGVSRNLEDIVHHQPAPEPEPEPIPSIEMDEPTPVAKGKQIEDVSMSDETFHTPAPIAEPVPEPEPIVEEVAPKHVKKAAKPRGRPPKVTLPVPSPKPSHRMERAPTEEAPVRHLTPAAPRSPLPRRSPTPTPKEATPSQSPQSSDAENHPPSSKPQASMKKATTPRSTKRIPLAATPSMSPSKRNVIAGLQTNHPWAAVDLDAVFLKSPDGDNAIRSGMYLFGSAIQKGKNGELTSPEKRMTVEEWIKFNAEQAEEKLRSECERMVGAFEREGTRAMRALEGVECIE